jgi:hypothetical protein
LTFQASDLIKSGLIKIDKIEIDRNCCVIEFSPAFKKIRVGEDTRNGSSPVAGQVARSLFCFFAVG